MVMWSHSRQQSHLEQVKDLQETRLSGNLKIEDYEKYKAVYDKYSKIFFEKSKENEEALAEMIHQIHEEQDASVRVQQDVAYSLEE